ncbi:hypothetical protein Pcinc_040536 [Petrolisthes cinctipes]|uniref:C-type lectin domain-containing protein n=1 Tax=Petrolisthes cinctipes TaxID=88211 RepID=A0AAE1BLA9_PETCI|nr:hypothetical protein Pcinc_040536 [Petrolisthes cinctipes]
MCVLNNQQQQQQQRQLQDLSDVELVVSGSDKPTGHYGWYNVSQKEFKALTLTCTAYNKSTGTPLNTQPKVFWSKDNVYLGHCFRDLTPATLNLQPQLQPPPQPPEPQPQPPEPQPPEGNVEGPSQPQPQPQSPKGNVEGLSQPQPPEGNVEGLSQPQPPQPTQPPQPQPPKGNVEGLSQPQQPHFTITSRHQGTYWCQTWDDTNSTQPLIHSNKILVTLRDRVVVNLEAHLNDTLKVSDVRDRLRDTFGHWFVKEGVGVAGGGDGDVVFVPNDDDNDDVFVLDPVAVSKTTKDNNNNNKYSSLVVKYTFQLHVLLTSLKDGDVRMFNYQRGVSDGDYVSNGFLPTSTVTLATFCLSETRSYGSSQVIQWPFTSAGNVHPINHRCHIRRSKLKAARCVWDYINGAYLTFDPSGCEWSDLCPKGYTMLSNWLCMAVSQSGSWGVGFKTVYKTGREMSILDHPRFLNTSWQRSGVYRHINNLVTQRTGGSSVIWLPVRRIRKFGPLNYLDPVAKDFRNNLPNVLETFNMTWAKGESNQVPDCLALDLATKELLIKHCSYHYPFVSIIKANFLKESVSDFSADSLISSNPLCDSGWQSTQLTENIFCFKLFNSSKKGLTWPETKAFCQTQNATLPSPNVEFLDWVYRKYIYSNGVPKVWINAQRNHGWRISFSGSMDNLNWHPTEDYKNKYGSLKPDGWVLEDENVTMMNILCQKRITHTKKLHLELVKSRVESSHTICIKAKQNELLNEGESLSCYVNGIYTAPIRPQYTHSCPYELEVNNQGYYECYAWSQKPTTLVHSNIILHEELDTFTFVFSLLHHQNYRLEKYDSTFAPPHTCSDHVVDYLAHNPHADNFDITAENLFYKPRLDTKLLENFHLKCKPKLNASHYTEEKVLNALVDLILDGIKLSNCSLNQIRRTTGCPKEVTWSLTWPQTEGKAVVIPEELCVTSEGEAVTRECLGDFVLGYFWTEAKNCTGQPTPVTRQLWHIKNNPQVYLSNSNFYPSLSGLTSNSPDLSSLDVHLVALILEAFTHLNTSSLHLDHMTDILNNVMGAQSRVLQASQITRNTSAILLESFEALTFKIELPIGQERALNVSRERISVQRLALETNSTVTGYKFSRKDTDSQEHGLVRQGDSRADVSDAEVAIVFPSNLLQPGR